MKRLAPWVLALSACGFEMNMGTQHDAAVGDDAPNVDAPEIDAPEIDAPDLCIGEGVREVCLAALPTLPLEFASSTTLDTSDSTTCTPTTNAQAAGWCVIAGTSLLILNGAQLRMLGNKPVVFATTGDMMIQGSIDVSSRGLATGGGANPSACVAGTNATSGNSSGGGYGGSFAGRGANGEGNDGGLGGVSPPIATISMTMPLRGGCAGGPGGPVSGQSAAGGAGGGAMALLSRTQIVLTNGTLNASGMGGKVGGNVRQGSGGGGSGGMIVLDAPVISTQGASLYANGGGGGEGNDSANVGMPGSEPLGATMAGMGGFGTTQGGDGGTGSLGANGSAPPMNANASGGGGGGGGGGAGVIISSVLPLTGANISPLPLGTP
jgi:hypothetical protein